MNPFHSRVDTASFAADGPIGLVSGGAVIGNALGYGAGVADVVVLPPDAEVVTGGVSWTGIGAHNLQVLGHGSNSRHEVFDSAVIEAMLADPAVKAAVETRLLQILCGELRFLPSVEDGADDEEGAGPGRPDPAEARWAAGFCERAHAQLDQPIPAWAWSFERDRLCFGHKVAEVVLKEADPAGPDAGLYTLDALKSKPRWSYHLCTDPYLNLLAVWAETRSGPAYIAAEHFLIASNQPQDGDPRGTSILRAAREPWRRKHRRLASQAAGDDQFGSPSVVLKLPPNALAESQVTNPATGRPYSTIEWAQMVLERFRNGFSIALPAGAEIEVVESGRDGSQLVNSIKYDDQEIVRAILNTTVGVLEPEHYTQGTGDHAQAKTRSLGDSDRDAFLAQVRRQVFRRLLAVNFGDAYADTYTPRLTLGAMAAEQFLQIANPMAVFGQAGLLYPSWLIELMVQAGFPRPRPGELRIGPAGPIPDELPPPEPKTVPAPAGKEGA